MRLHLDCFPCAFRMAIEAMQMNNDQDDGKLYDRARCLMAEMSAFRNEDTAPELITRMQRLIKEWVHCDNLYSSLKLRDLGSARSVMLHLNELYPKEFAIDIKTALLISAIGNTLDSGISLTDELSDNINKELSKGFSIYDGKTFTQKLAKADTVLILGDNIAEAVLDRYLITTLAPRHCVYAVRECAILNDTALGDVDEIAIDGVEYISTGSDVCGVVPSECSERFLDVFNLADIVISKGMGNYETLSGKCTRDIFYLLKAKCQTMAEEHGVGRDEYVFRYVPI